MNIKKFLIISCITLQLSTLLHASASQLAYNNAFVAFYQQLTSSQGTPCTPAQAANYLFGIRGKSNNIAPLQTLANNLNTPQAQAVGAYLSKGTALSLANKFINQDSSTNLQTALSGAANFTTAINPTISTGSTVTPPLTANTTSSTTSSTTPSTSSTTPSTTTTPAAPVGPTVISPLTATTTPTAPVGPTAKQTAANQLQQQIESAKTLFNTIVPGAYTATPLIALASLPA